MGFWDSKDQFLMVTDPIVSGVDQVDKSIDDVLSQCTSFKQMTEALNEVLRQAIKRGFKFSTSKFKICNRIKFGGFIVSASNTGVVTNIIFHHINFNQRKSFFFIKSSGSTYIFQKEKKNLLCKGDILAISN